MTRWSVGSRRAVRDRAKLTSRFPAGPFARWLHWSLLKDPGAGDAPPSRLASGQNFRQSFIAVKYEFIFSRPLMALAMPALLAIALGGPRETRAAVMPPSGVGESYQHHGGGAAGKAVVRKGLVHPSLKSAQPIWPQGYSLHDVQGWVRVVKNRSYPRLVFAHRRKGWPKFIRLLPNLTLAAILEHHASHASLVQVSGEVTAYKGKNYLLLDANVAFPSSRIPTSPEKLPATATRPAPHPFSRRTPPNPKKIIHSLLSHHISRPAGLNAAPPDSMVQPPLPAPGTYRSRQWTALPEGTYIWNQCGRLLRNPVTHQWLFVFRSDGRGTGRPPIILLPCRRLAVLEAQNNGPDGGKPFLVSGEVTEYHHHNFLLLTAAERFYLLDRF